MDTKGMVRKTDPDTSHLAAQTIVPKCETIRQQVLQLFVTNGRMTDYALERLYCEVYGPRPYTSIHKRRGELRDAGRIRDSGVRSTIPTGSKVIVWELVVK